MRSVTWLPDEQWLPANPPTRSLRGNRSAADLSAIIAQFGVATHKRYRPVPKRVAVPATATTPEIPAFPGATYCKTFAEDVATAMVVAFPHWVDSAAAGNPAAPGRSAVELNINSGLLWLTVHGQRFGWSTSAAEADARAAACRGELALAVWRNPAGHGHVVVLVPPRGDSAATSWVAQAGVSCYEYGALTAAFPRGITPVFFIHP